MAGGVKKPTKVTVRVKPVPEKVRKPITPLKTSVKKVKKPVSDRKQSRVKGEKQMQERLKFWLALSESKPELKVKPDDQVQANVDKIKILTVDSNDRLLDRKTVAAETSIVRECDRKYRTSSERKPVKPDSVKPPANDNIDDSLNLTVATHNFDSDQQKKPDTYIFVDGQVDERAGGPGRQPVRGDGVYVEEALQQESYKVSEVLTLPTTPPATTTLAVLQVRNTIPNTNYPVKVDEPMRGLGSSTGALPAPDTPLVSFSHLKRKQLVLKCIMTNFKAIKL